MITAKELSEKLQLEHVIIKGDEIMASCPYAHMYHDSGKDTRPSFGLNMEKGVYFCFACGSRGNIEQLLVNTQNLTYLEATLLLEEWGYDAIEMMLREPTIQKQAPTLREATLLQFEDVSTEFMETYKGDIDGRACLIFPVRSFTGVLVGGLARSVEERFHMILWGLEKSQYLFGEDRIVDNQPLVVVEGPKDVAAVRAAGMHAVALMGAHVSGVQIAKLIRYSSDIIVWLDSDAAGKLGYKKLTTGLEDAVDVRYVVNHFLGKGKGDADEVFTNGGVELVQKFVHNSKSLLEILYDWR